MALAQLEYLAHIDTATQNRRVRETFELGPRERPRVEWAHTITFPLLRNADIVSKLDIGVRVAAAPQGYRWKRCWPLFFVKKLALEIGGNPIWTTNSDTLRMRYLIDGIQTNNDWHALLQNAPLEMTQTPPECLFDFGEEERTRLSAKPHEVLFEPLCLAELIQSKYKIPLICLAYHEVRLVLETSTLEECLEPIGVERPPLPVAQNELIEKCNFSGSYAYVQSPERRSMAHNEYETLTKHHNHCAGVFEKPLGGSLRTYVRAFGYCSAAYIWITDEAGNELPTQVLEKLKVSFMGYTREELTGFQSRMSVRQELPHPTLPNTKSQNLYYISYYPGRADMNGLEQGANFARINTVSIDFSFFAEAPQRMKINLVHREQNKLKMMTGLGGLVYESYPLLISTQRVPHPHDPPPPPPPQPFQNEDQLIEIYKDEPRCMITWTDFEEGEAVQQCLRCKKVMNSDAIDAWIQQRPHNKKCIHCQGPYSTTTFRKGRAHLVDGERVVVPIVRQRAVQVQQQGFCSRLFSAIGFRTRPVHPGSN